MAKYLNTRNYKRVKQFESYSPQVLQEIDPDSVWVFQFVNFTTSLQSIFSNSVVFICVVGQNQLLKKTLERKEQSKAELRSIFTIKFCLVNLGPV